MEVQDIELSCNDIILLQQLVDCNKELEDILDIAIENVRMLMVNMSQKRHEKKRNIFINIARNQGSIMRHMTKNIAEANPVEHCSRKYGNQEN